MVRGSNPRLMARILEVIKHLGDGRGSSAKQVLELLKSDGPNIPARNLTMQVHRALKNAVAAGLLQLRGGRYRMLLSLKSGGNKRRGKGTTKTTSKTGAGAERSITDKQKSSKEKNESDDVKGSSPVSLSPAPLVPGQQTRSGTCDAGRKKRCVHCKKQKRHGSKRRRKRGSKYGKRDATSDPRQAKQERQNRRRQRRGDDDNALIAREGSAEMKDRANFRRSSLRNKTEHSSHRRSGDVRRKSRNRTESRDHGSSRFNSHDQMENIENMDGQEMNVERCEEAGIPGDPRNRGNEIDEDDADVCEMTNTR